MADPIPESTSAARRFPRTRRVLLGLWRVLSAPFRWLGRFVRYLAQPERSWTQRLVLAPVGVGGFALGGLLLYFVVLWPFTPSIRHIQQLKVQHPTVLLSADGQELMRFQSLNREWVGLDQIAPHVPAALIATEDHRFYDHVGVDPWRLAASVVHTLRGDRQGGSTLTMQLARNLFPQRIGRSPSVHRKAKEILTALKIEFAYEKDEILASYLNTVPFLYNAFGIEMAARTYFSKPAADLDVMESATLVGMLKATSYYNPVRHPERAQQRRNVVLGQMVKRGALSAGEAETLRDQPTRLRFERQPLPRSQAPHFTAYVRAWLEAWADEEGYDLYTGGLRVRTTLDTRLQRLAEAAVQRQGDALQAVADVEWSQRANPLRSESPHDYPRLQRQVDPFAYFWQAEDGAVDRFVATTDRYVTAVAGGEAPEEALRTLRADRAFMDSLKTVKTRLEAGFVALDPSTGHVRAWVGSRDYFRDQYDKVAQARRQPGSTFKPFVYAAALERGFTPEHRLPDRPVEIRVDDDQIWRPVNAGGFSNEDVTLREALAQSKNSISAQLIADVGPRRTARLARAMGVNRSALEAVPSLALGTSEVTLLEMASAYATIAAGGLYRTPTVVSRIDAADGTVLATFEPEPERAVSEETALALTDMMRDVIDRGTGRRIRSVFGIRADVAGKTGTTQENADGWFLMMHPQLVAGSWVGFNDPRVRFRSDYWGQGSHNALYVVGDFYRHALRQGRISPTPSLGPAPTYEAPDQRTFLARAGDWLETTLGGLFSGSDDAPADAPRLAENQPPVPAAPTERAEAAERRDAVSVEASPERIVRTVRDIGRLVGFVDGLLGGDGQAAIDEAVREAERYLDAQQAEEQPRVRVRVSPDDLRDLDGFVDRALDEYGGDLTPSQRRAVERELDRLLNDLQRGRDGG